MRTSPPFRSMTTWLLGMTSNGTDWAPSLSHGAAQHCRLKQTPESLEAQLSQKLQEYSENRSLTSVLPVENPLASDEPELLEMSPEEAEGTQL